MKDKEKFNNPMEGLGNVEYFECTFLHWFFTLYKKRPKKMAWRMDRQTDRQTDGQTDIANL